MLRNFYHTVKMGDLRSSEIDRALRGDGSDYDSLASEEEWSDLFGDDSDIDPLYQPENDQLDDSDLDEPRPTTSGNVQGSSRTNQTAIRPDLGRPTQNRPINRNVISSSSDSEDENIYRPTTDNDIWLAINDESANRHDFTHDFSYNETPGPKHCPPVESKPIEYFNLFFTEILLNIFVTETNRYANQTITELADNLSPRSRKQNWVAVGLTEMKAFIAVILNMGLIRKPTIPSYWSTKDSQATPWFRKMFTRNRFQLLLAFFHIVDNTKLPKANQPDYDASQKFQPLLEHCNRLFKFFYTAHQQVSVDETLIGTKSQTAITQYLPNKHHHRWGIKLWVLCDSISNYCMSMICYKGKKGSSEVSKQYGLGYAVVTSLLRACNYLNKGFHVYTDNFFTSVPLVKKLYEWKTFFTGTVRKNKKGLPDGIKQSFQVGQKKYYKQGKVLAFGYRQKKSQQKPVLLLSSKTEISEAEDTKRRHGRITREKKPSIILDYNKHMGGIDTFDMMLYSYLDERRTVKYWKKVVFNLFSRMVTNSYIIYKENCTRHNKKCLSRFHFLVEIIESITAEWIDHRQDLGMEIDGNQRLSGVEKLPGKMEKTCFVCTKKGPTFKTNRKRSRTVCVVCKEGCHGPCFPKHKCP